jgi:hypothetical protein
MITVAVRPAMAQVTITATVGVMQYDAGQDDRYTIIGLQGKYAVTPSFRIGLVGSTAHIGDPPLREWTLEGTDERIWRFSGFAELGTRPFKKSSIAIRAMLGVFHSSGVIVEEPPDNDPFYGITDTNTGIAWGGGAGVEFGPYSGLRFMAQANLWMDHAYGGQGFDPELLFGIGLDL